MARFTMKDYKKALKGAGPKLRENVLARAAEDPSIGFWAFMELCDYAYDQRPERRQNHGTKK